jgi:hypothetical protein
VICPLCTSGVERDREWLTEYETLELAWDYDRGIDSHVMVSAASYLVDGPPTQTHKLYVPLGLMGATFSKAA